MNGYTSPILITIVAILAGWWLAGWFGTAGVETRPALPPVSSSRVAAPAVSGLNPDHARAAWSGPTIPVEEFHGNLSIWDPPTVNMEHLLDRGPAITLIFHSMSSLDTRSTWLELRPAEVQLLTGILKRAADRQLAWETANLRGERLKRGEYQLIWRESGPEALALLQNELADAFGETRARSIWIRGGLDRFHEPVPGWKRRGIGQIDVQLTRADQDGWVTVRVTHGDFTRTWDRSVATLATSFPLRLRHIFQVEHDAAEMIENRPRIEEAVSHPYPVAE